MKLSIEIMKQMYGSDRKYKDIMKKMEMDILDAREKRGAGEKPFLQKYDPKYLCEEEK